MVVAGGSSSRLTALSMAISQSTGFSIALAINPGKSLTNHKLAPSKLSPSQ
jgi:hypothetical protein